MAMMSNTVQLTNSAVSRGGEEEQEDKNMNEQKQLRFCQRQSCSEVSLVSDPVGWVNWFHLASWQFSHSHTLVRFSGHGIT